MDALHEYNRINEKFAEPMSDDEMGKLIKLAYVDQSRNDLDPNKSLWEVISDGLEVVKLGKRQINSRAYVARFNFSGSDQQKKVSIDCV